MTAKAVHAWADAWSRKDMKAYLGAYASDFDTPKGMSRKAWEQEREQRIAGKGGKISVSVDNHRSPSTATRRPPSSANTTRPPACRVDLRPDPGPFRVAKWLIKEETLGEKGLRHLLLVLAAQP